MKRLTQKFIVAATNNSGAQRFDGLKVGEIVKFVVLETNVVLNADNEHIHFYITNSKEAPGGILGPGVLLHDNPKLVLTTTGATMFHTRMEYSMYDYEIKENELLYTHIYNGSNTDASFRITLIYE